MSDTNDGILFKGFTRVAIIDDDTGNIVGDSGFKSNLIQVRGFTQMIYNNVSNTGSPEYPNYLCLGQLNNTAIGSNNLDTLFSYVGVPQEAIVSATKSAVTTSQGTVLQLTATFAGGTYVGQSPISINGIAGQHTTNTNKEFLFGTNFTQSTWSSQQTVQVTYQLKWTQ